MNFEIQTTDIVTGASCPSCNSQKFDELSRCFNQYNVNFLATALCNDCGHVFRNKVPSEAWFNHAFALRHSEQQKTGFNPLSPEIEQQRYDRYHAIGKHLRSYSQKIGSLLDVGCGPGTGLDALNDLEFDVVGVDPDESRAKIALEKGHEIHLGEFKSFKTDQKFDFITLIHSLEHFQFPEVFLTKALEHSHRGTLFYVEVPEVLDHVKDWNDSLYLAHISNFNDLSLVQLADRCGWEFQEKVNPYIDTPLHKGHLAMIFSPKRAEVEPEKAIEKNINPEIRNEIRKRYYNGLEEPDVNSPVNFHLREINDISLSYKGISELKTDVHDNYANRTLRKTGENSYYVG